MATTTLPDDQIAEVRARLEDLERRVGEKRDAAAAARAELDQLEANSPHGQVPPWSTRAVSAWHQSVSRAERALAASQTGLGDLERQIAEDARWLAELERRRVPKFDDAIAEARARLAQIPIETRPHADQVATLEARIRGYDAAEAVGDPLPNGEPAASSGRLAEVREAITGLETERTRLDLRVATLLERRQVEVVELADADRRELEARWELLAGESLDAAVRLHAIALELSQLEEAYRAVGPRYGLTGGRMPTVDDQRWSPEQLERSIVAIARGLALRNGAG